MTTSKDIDLLGEKDSGVWHKLAEPLPSSAISWRQDGKVINKDGRCAARFVCYVEAGTVRERLDSVVPGEWDLTVDVLPVAVSAGGEVDGDSACAFKARLTILGVMREDVGHGKDYKQASTDAFKRVAVRFGIGHELYNMEQLWVEMDGDGKYAKPTEDPQKAYERKYGNGAGVQTRSSVPPGRDAGSTPAAPSANPNHNLNTPQQVADALEPPCPKCGGRVWDNRLTKKNPKAPDFKCRNRSCDGVIWPVREDEEAEQPQEDPDAWRSNVDSSELPF